MPGRPAKSFSKLQIQDVINNSRSYLEAARHLNASYNTFKKYAQLYVDEEGNSLWKQGGLNPSAKGIPKLQTHQKQKSILNILEGNKNGQRLNLTRLLNSLIREAILPEHCDKCNMDEKRITDLKAPLKISFLDGDRTNYKRENLRLLCLNCSFLTEGNIVGRRKKYFTDDSGEIYEI